MNSVLESGINSKYVILSAEIARLFPLRAEIVKSACPGEC